MNVMDSVERLNAQFQCKRPVPIHGVVYTAIEKLEISLRAEAMKNHQIFGPQAHGYVAEILYEDLLSSEMDDTFIPERPVGDGAKVILVKESLFQRLQLQQQDLLKKTSINVTIGDLLSAYVAVGISRITGAKPCIVVKTQEAFKPIDFAELVKSKQKRSIVADKEFNISIE